VTRFQLMPEFSPSSVTLNLIHFNNNLRILTYIYHIHRRNLAKKSWGRGKIHYASILRPVKFRVLILSLHNPTKRLENISIFLFAPLHLSSHINIPRQKIYWRGIYPLGAHLFTPSSDPVNASHGNNCAGYCLLESDDL
jgi:hypothetical protein